MTQILIADDHEVVRHGLRALLEARHDWLVCGEAVNGRQAVEMTAQLQPDIVIIDITLPELNGVEATRQIHRSHPQVGILVLTVHQSEELARKCLRAGASGYVLKSDAGRDLVTAVQSIQRQELFISPRLGSQFQVELGACQRPPTVVPANDLTPREFEVLQLVAEGKSSKEVANALVISVQTVLTHRRNLMQKLQLHSVAELVHYAIRNQIASP